MTKEQVHQAIDRLSAEQLRRVESILGELRTVAPCTDDPRERWRRIPGLRVPDEWPPHYGEFEPVSLQGEPVSEQVIRERR